MPEGHALIGDNHIVKGSVSVTGGAPGVGKSRSGVALAQAGSRGKGDWFGLPVHRQFKTAILQNENGQARLKNELTDIKDDMEEWVRISLPPPFGMQFDKDAFCDQLSNLIEDFLPDVLIIDPWNSAARNTKQEDYLAAFQAIQSVLPQGDDKPHIHIVAHTRKPKADEKHSGRALLNLLAGSYVLGSVPRCAFVMQSATDDVEDERVVWTCCKNNDGELGPRSAWVRKNGLFEPVQDFNWESFDSGGNGNKLGWKDVPSILKRKFFGITKTKDAVAFLVAQGVKDSTAYRWLDKAVEDGLIKRDGGLLSL